MICKLYFSKKHVILVKFLPNWKSFYRIGKIFTELERFLPNWKSFYQTGKIFTKLERFLPNWKNFYQIGKNFTELEKFLPKWKSFYQIGKILGHKKTTYKAVLYVVFHLFYSVFVGLSRSIPLSYCICRMNSVCISFVSCLLSPYILLNFKRIYAFVCSFFR